MSVKASCLGYPRMGVARELKAALEAYWAGKTSATDLQTTAAELRRRHWLTMREKGIDHVPGNDFSLYDHVLDMAVTLGAVPARFAAIGAPLDRYFAMARGRQDVGAGIDVAALEMTKWFDTNYHYIVPEIAPGQAFALDATRIVSELEEARGLGIETRPVLLGPVSFLLLSKLAPGGPPGVRTLDALDGLLLVYEELLAELAARRVPWVQLDEPCLALDLDEGARRAYRQSWRRFDGFRARPRLMLASYFGGLEGNRPLALDSGCDGLHVDLVRAPDQLARVLATLPPAMVLSLGLVDGRNVWRTDLDRAHRLLRSAVTAVGPDRVMVGPSCSLLHVPEDVAGESRLDRELVGWLAFAAQKLDEIRALADAAEMEAADGPLFAAARAALATRRASPRTRNAAVRERAAAVDAAMLRRASPFAVRAPKQRACFALPPFPTTTIGSFPQTAEVRAARAAHRAGRLSVEDYEDFLRREIQRCVEAQERLGLDVLVHGEFERNDMVEYFGERLEGFAFTEQGWVQSYGSRCVKPPVLFGDVRRPAAMTVEWARFAQGLTRRPMKGMLTGPVTILQWSFVRDDQPRSATCRQIALALRDEVADLEAAGIAVVQVDEPALREGLPLRRREWRDYLRWAVDAFRLATAGVRDETQVHTHMCYSEFGDILAAIAEMDADTLLIETSRSKMELLGDFARCGYPNELGPGVYDIHSPRVPSREEMVDLLERAARVVPAERLWVNPDCGLKTRSWDEVERALANMVAAAQSMRRRFVPERDAG